MTTSAHPRSARRRSVPTDATTGGSLPANGDPAAREARRRLVRAAGEFSRDFGMGRVVGEVMMYLYLTEGAVPIERIERDLGLSKAAVSIAARQLERLGFVVRERRAGDRRRFYRSADHLGEALRLGLLTLLRSKLDGIGADLETARALLQASADGADASERRFLLRRIERAATLRRRAAALLQNPIARMLLKMG